MTQETQIDQGDDGVHHDGSAVTEHETLHSDNQDIFEQGTGRAEDAEMLMNVPQSYHVVEDVTHVSRQKQNEKCVE